MAKLVLKGPQGTQELPLDTRPLSIGRRNVNSLVLDDPAVSGRHAHVFSSKGRYFVEDLKSSNGTLVNGKPVSRWPLSHGDTLRIGQHQILFMEAQSEPEEEPSPDLLGTLVTMAPPKPKAPESTPPESEHQFLIQDDKAPSTPPAAAAAPAQPEPQHDPQATTGNVDMLDELVGSIRSHREREQTEKERKQAEFQAEWDKALTLAEQLKAKIGGDERVKYFAISRSNNDVMIRFRRSENAPVVFVMLSQQHPDGNRGQPLSGIWMRRSGQQDRCFPKADELFAELVREIAFLVA